MQPPTKASKPAASGRNKVNVAARFRARRPSALFCRLGVRGPGLMFPNLAQLELHVAREHVLGRALALERNFRRHWTLGAYPTQGNLQGFHRMGDRVLNGGGFVTAMNHAIGAFRIISGAVGIPIRFLHQLAEGLGIALAEQIAGALPTEHGAGRIAPGRAMVFLIPRQEVEEQTGLAERPGFAGATATEDVAEQLLGFLAMEKMLLVRRSLVGVAG